MGSSVVAQKAVVGDSSHGVSPCTYWMALGRTALVYLWQSVWSQV